MNHFDLLNHWTWKIFNCQQLFVFRPRIAIMTVCRKSFSTSSLRNPPRFLFLGRAWCQMGQEDQYLAKNDQKYHFRAKIGRFWANYGKPNTLPKFCRTQISFLGSVLTSYGSKTYHSPWASVSQLIFLKMTKYTTLGPKLAVLGLISAKLSLYLSFAAPKFHSWDLFWLFLVAKLITTHEQAWASSFFSKWPNIPL